MLCQPPVTFLGVEFERVDITQALDWVVQQSKADSFSYLVTPNVDHIVQIHRSDNGDAAQAFEGANFIVCDSRILSLLARVSGLQVPVVPGSDLTRELLVSLAQGTRIAVVGGDQALLARLASRYPKYSWMAHYPPMGVRTDPSARQAIADFVSASQADIVLFAIGAPQSELTCREIALQGRARGTALCIGASLEFLTGAKKRAPLWMQGLALEWLFRLLSEPRRLWRRYLVLGPSILVIWWRWRLAANARLDAGSASIPSGGLSKSQDKLESSKPHRSEREPSP